MYLTRQPRVKAMLGLVRTIAYIKLPIPCQYLETLIRSSLLVASQSKLQSTIRIVLALYLALGILNFYRVFLRYYSQLRQIKRVFQSLVTLILRSLEISPSFLALNQEKSQLLNQVSCFLVLVVVVMSLIQTRSQIFLTL